jgi:poly-beta-1,6-N-acetyl-D-glucosamine synthase
MHDVKFIIITPARNEANYLGKAIESIVSQTRLPSEWVIVDDGSTDATASIAARAARTNSWIKVVSCENRGYRNHDFGMVEAFYYGLNRLTINDYEFVFLMDADIIIKPNYFEVILKKFEVNNNLGIASGQVYEVRNGKLIKLIAMPWSTCGQVKCWRGKCFQEIEGLARGLGWDIIDNYKAMMLGWQTQTFEDEEIKILHLRPAGWSEKSIPHELIRSGRAMHFRGTHPLWLLASAVYNMLHYPSVVGGFCLIIGYLQAFLQGSEQYNDKNFRRFLRKWQLNKLAEILRLH